MLTDVDEENRGTRARPMSRDDRRAAIALATVPLLEEHGAQVSTRQIALAAGVAEGTLFRAFDDKVELLTAAAERALDPTSGVAEIDDLPPAASLADELVQIAGVLAARGRRVRRIMVAVHGILASEDGRRAVAVRGARGADLLGHPVPGHAPRAGSAPDGSTAAGRPPLHHGGGRAAHLRALAEVRAAVVRRVEAYGDELRVDPDRLAHLLLTTVPGLGPPGLSDDAEIPLADVVDVLLHGAARST